MVAGYVLKLIISLFVILLGCTFFTNAVEWFGKKLNLAFIASFLLQVVVLIVPPLRELFKLTSLNFEQWTIIILASLSIIPIVEVVKYFTRHFHKE